MNKLMKSVTVLGLCFGIIAAGCAGKETANPATTCQDHEGVKTVRQLSQSQSASEIIILCNDDYAKTVERIDG